MHTPPSPRVRVPPPGWLWRRRFDAESPLWAAALDTTPATSRAGTVWLLLWMARLEQIARHTFAGPGSEMISAAPQLQRIGFDLAAGGDGPNGPFATHLRLLPRKIALMAGKVGPAVAQLPTFRRDWARWSDALSERFMRRGPAGADESARSARAIWGGPARFAMWLIGEADEAALDRAGIVGGAAGEMLALLRWRREAQLGILPFPEVDKPDAGDAVTRETAPADDSMEPLIAARQRTILAMLASVRPDPALPGPGAAAVHRLDRIVRALALDPGLPRRLAGPGEWRPGIRDLRCLAER